ncbi:hypothetical protein Tco_0712714 [Tanacetum coccineum]
MCQELKGFGISVYGFFLGKHIAYPIVENYVKNTWSKYGFVKLMMNSSNGLFFFKISSGDVMDAMLENHPCEDVLSVIATNYGPPLMLESYTSVMRMKSLGRSSYAKAMFELRANVELKDTIMVAVPKLVGEGFSMCTICIEYECKPPSCSSCKVFGHVMDEFPKNLLGCVEEFKGILDKLLEEFRIEKDDDLGTNNGNSKLAKKGANSDMVSSSHVTLSEAFVSPTTTPLAERINDLERQMLDKKLMLVDDDRKPLKNVDDPVDAVGRGVQ